MTLNEILKANGVNDEAISAIAAAMKENKMYTASEENLDIRYGKLKTQHDGVNQQLTAANALIEELKNSNKGNEGLQQKVTAYEQQVAQLQKELEETKIDAEARVGLLAARAMDVDYLLYKLKEKARADEKPIALDENGKIKGWDDLLSALQTQVPNMFESASGDGDGYQVFKPNRLKDGDGGGTTVTREQFKGMGYEERMALKQKNEKLYNELVK